MDLKASEIDLVEAECFIKHIESDLGTLKEILERLKNRLTGRDKNGRDR